jgi:hypothetical protein
MNWLQVILALLQLAPVILQTVTTVESAVAGTKKGKVKKAVVMAAIAGAPQPVVDAASSYIDMAVTALNEAGVLVHAEEKAA